MILTDLWLVGRCSDALMSKQICTLKNLQLQVTNMQKFNTWRPVATNLIQSHKHLGDMEACLIGCHITCTQNSTILIYNFIQRMFFFMFSLLSLEEPVFSQLYSEMHLI